MCSRPRGWARKSSPRLGFSTRVVGNNNNAKASSIIAALSFFPSGLGALQEELCRLLATKERRQQINRDRKERR
jgi:hypothetical protein